MTMDLLAFRGGLGVLAAAIVCSASAATLYVSLDSPDPRLSLPQLGHDGHEHPAGDRRGGRLRMGPLPATETLRFYRAVWLP